MRSVVDVDVDVGGGTGAMLAEILRIRPELHGTLIDPPGAVARAAETFRAAGVADRVATVGQSFFDPLPAGGTSTGPARAQRLARSPDSRHPAPRAEAARPDGRVVPSAG